VHSILGLRRNRIVLEAAVIQKTVDLNLFHTTDADPTKLFCRVGVGGVNRVGDSFQ